MKAEPEYEVGNGDNAAPISGDVIGDTAYSERFVLKILLKLANRDTLREESKEPAFEEELCTLWDMTAEKDVVLYLQTHNTMNLFCFALPVIESSRIIEVIIGTIANMCCHKEAVNSLIANKDLTLLLLDFLKSDDSQILIQLLRLISSCVYVADVRDIGKWMDLFETVEYAQSLYFILNNSSNTELLKTALENLNTICMNWKVEAREKFSLLFETPDALTAVYTAHREYSSQASPEEKLERFHLISLQMMLHLNNTENFNNEEEGTINAMNLLRDILNSYEIKMNEYCKIDMGLLNVLDAATGYFLYQQTSQACSPDKYFNPSYNMWKTLHETQKQTGKQQFFDDLKSALGLILCIYMSKCTNEHLLTILDDIGDDYGSIVSQIKDAELQAKIANRALNYRNGKLNNEEEKSINQE